MSILGELIAAGVVLSLSDDEYEWNDVVGKKFSEETERLVSTEKANVEVAENAVYGNAKELEWSILGLAKNTNSELDKITTAAESIRNRVRGLDPKKFYEQSEKLKKSGK